MLRNPSGGEKVHPEGGDGISPPRRRLWTAMPARITRAAYMRLAEKHLETEVSGAMGGCGLDNGPNDHEHPVRCAAFDPRQRSRRHVGVECLLRHHVAVGQTSAGQAVCTLQLIPALGELNLAKMH